MKDLIKVINKCIAGIEDSKIGLTTYEDDSQAEHGDGQQVGREDAYREIIKFCANEIAEKI